MSLQPRLRRSALYMPGSNARALEKGRSLAADMLILDLEDAVAPEAKDLARETILQSLSGGGYGEREILVRVNGLDTPWGQEDLDVMAKSGAGGILLPKVNGAAQVSQALEHLNNASAPDDLMIWCMVETPLGVLHAEEIATSSSRIAGFVMGTSDLAKELHCLHTPQRLPFMTSLNQVILVARAYGLAALDGVYLDLSDDEGFLESCQQGLELGFDGKTLIHPKTINAANTVFGPSTQDITRSKAIIAAFEEAQANEQAVIVLDGKLIEMLHVEEAKRILSLADMIEQRKNTI